MPLGGSDAQPASRAIWWLALAIAWFATIGLRPLLEPDEGRYAEIPREMYVSGDWVTPRLNGVKYFEKPALQYWATAAAYSAFGVSEWTARLWSCALAFSCIPLVFGFARWLYSSEAAGAAAATVLAINPYFAILGQINLLDSGFCFFLTVTVFAYLRGWMVAAAAALALAVLAKGIAALVLVAGALVLYLAVTREFRSVRNWQLSLSVPVFLLVSVPWFVVVSERNPEFPAFFFIHEHFTRYLTDSADRVEPWWYFLPFVLLAVLPWLGSAVAAARTIRLPDAWDDRSRARAFLLAWCAFLLFFFSVSHSKLAPYVMPMMPALAVLLAPAVAARAGALKQASWVVAGLVVLAAIGLVIAAGHRSDEIPGALVLWSAAAVVIVSLSELFARGRWAVAAAGAVLGFQALLVAYSTLPPVRTAKALVEAARHYIGPETELFSVNQYRQSVPPYLGRTLRMVSFQGELEFGLRQAPSRYIPTVRQFAEKWRASRDAVAFIDPPIYDELVSSGVPLYVIARDGRSVVVARHVETAP